LAVLYEAYLQEEKTEASPLESESVEQPQVDDVQERPSHDLEAVRLEVSQDAAVEKNSHLQEEIVEGEDNRDLRRTVPAGHYVQVFATQEYDASILIRDRFRELLSDRLENPEEEVFIIHRRQFYEVLIGTFEQFSAAQQILPPAVAYMSDAFIITLDRPLHLEELYEGTIIIHDE
jgi:hypothetical protein